MASATLCRCICGSRDEWDRHDVSSAPGMPPLEEVQEEKWTPAPKAAGRIAYSMSADQQLRGVPIREGDLWHLSTEERVDQVRVFLHVNGFRFSTDGQEVSISLTPFTLVRNCKFQSNHNGMNFSEFKIFKISLFAQGACYYFGIRGVSERDAEEERSRWVLDISRIMRLVTQSLFPIFQISCDPIKNAELSESRLMAGYLVHYDDCFTASVLYCELHVNTPDHARFIFYEDETCTHQLSEIYVTERSICCEKIGINCSCFSIEDHQFTARSLGERKLWLRAISNLKVKLQNGAPPPSQEEILEYRAAIKEHVAKIHGLDNVKTDALLQRAEAPMWADSHAPDECTALDGAFALALAPNLGTLPSPPSHLDLRIDRPMAADQHGHPLQDASVSSSTSAKLQRSSSLTEPPRRYWLYGRERSKSFEQPLPKPEG